MVEQEEMDEEEEEPMTLNDINNEPTNQFRDLCTEFNLNHEFIQHAWKNYDSVCQQCALEGEELAWMSAAIYVTMWQKTSFDGMNNSNRMLISLSKLINLSGVSVLELFEKLSKWADMAGCPRRIVDQVSKVQNNFAVSAVIFKKFLPLFCRVFTIFPPDHDTQPKRGAKRLSKSTTKSSLTSGNLFEFCWILFISTRKQFSTVGDDLMNSFHLLLCCVDFVHRNLIDAGKTEYLASEFSVVDKDGDGSILDVLCRTFEGVVLDAKHFRVHWWLPKVKRLIKQELLLKGDTPTLCGILDNIADNTKLLQSNYQDAILRRGEMDESIFLPEDMNTLFTQEGKKDPLNRLKRSPDDRRPPLDTDLLLRMTVQSCLEKVGSYRIPTPLSGKSYVISGDQFCPVTPVSAATQNAARLASMLADCELEGPGSELERIFSLCVENPGPSIEALLNEMIDAFEKRCVQEKMAKGSQFDEGFCAFLDQRKSQIVCLFYRLLERVIVSERDRAKSIDFSDFTGALRQETFHRSLFAVSLELVLFSYNSERAFPWVLEVLHMPAIHFYKVIELVIRSEPELSREMVKHLNAVEERVLEELAWKRDSPLWDLLNDGSEKVPFCQEVALPSQLDRATGIPSVLTTEGARKLGVNLSSPLGAYGRFQSPVKVSAVAKRKLDFDGSSSPNTSGEQSSPPVKLSAIEVRTGTAHKVPGGVAVGTIRLPLKAGEQIQLQSMPARQKSGSATPPLDGNSDQSSAPRRRSSSLALFFRKVYYLASVRLLDLCERLRLDEKAKQHVWTLFERVLRNETQLMCGRHLDQNLMCCLYVTAKVLKHEMSFHDIMCQYRNQPQAQSRVYRSVLLGSPNSGTDDFVDESSQDSTDSGFGEKSGGDKLRSDSTLPVPDISSTPPTPEPKDDQYGDLIKFYNKLFVSRVGNFAKKFTPGDSASKENLSVPLSPMPSIRSQMLSPRRSITDSVCVQPMQQGFPLSPSRPLRYSFNRSPYKDLKAINSMIRQGADFVPGKPMAFGLNPSSSYKRYIEFEGSQPTTSMSAPTLTRMV